MLQRLLSVFVIGFILAACSPSATPQPTPEPPLPPVETPAVYPPPVQPIPPGAYPAPDDPVTPGDPVFPGVYPSPLDPIPGEDAMVRGEVFIDDVQLLILESFPPRYSLQLNGSLPTPCHHLRAEVPEPDAQNRIDVEIYSLVDPNVACIQVLEPFDTNVLFGPLPQGNYTVLVNGQQVGEIEAP